MAESWPRMASALTLAMIGCGPTIGGGGGSASAEGSSGATGDGTGEAASSAASGTGTSAPTGDTSTGAPDVCPDNVANEPFCYRRFDIDWGGELGGWHGAQNGRAGNFGPDGELAFLLAGDDAGTPMALAFWNGEGFDVQPWGVVPVLDKRAGKVPVRMFDGIHSDLIVGDSTLDPTLAVAPWTIDGPGEPMAVEPPTPEYIVSLFGAQAVLDVDADGLEEVAVYVGPYIHRLVRNVDGVPVFFGDELTHYGQCGGNVGGIAAGHLDSDGLTDLAAMGSCEVRNKGGVFAFAAEWGDGLGGFASEGVEFPAQTPSMWLGVADLDGDGIDDVVTASEDASEFYETYVEFHRSRGDRTFEPPLRFWTEFNPPGAFDPKSNPIAALDAFMLGDVDGDGVDDLVFQRFMLAVVHATDDPQYLEMFDVKWDDDTTEVVAGFDLNEDGRLDFVVHDAVEGTYALMSSD